MGKDNQIAKKNIIQAGKEREKKMESQREEKEMRETHRKVGERKRERGI